MLQRFKALLSPEQRRIIGAEAQQSLNDRHWREAFESVEAHIIGRMREAKDKDHAMLVATSLQLLDALKRELHRKIEDGEMARIELAELERRSAVRVFRR